MKFFTFNYNFIGFWNLLYLIIILKIIKKLDKNEINDKILHLINYLGKIKSVSRLLDIYI